jgi:zinc protease
VGPKLVFGDEPYGRTGTGTAESVGSVTSADVSNFYASHYGPKDSALIFSGDLTRPEAERLAKEHFGKWEGKTEAAMNAPAAPAAQPTHIVIVDKPGAPQTALQAFGIGVPANSPDAETLTVMNYTLGASFGSRINFNLREVHGYTYGARSSFTEYVDGGMFVAGGLVRTDVTAPAAQELMKEIRGFPEKPSTAEELAAAKAASIQSLPGHFETTAAVVGAIDGIFLYDRPLDYYTRLPGKYEAVTQADIARVAQQYLHPDQLVIVTAGDRSKIEPALKDAGLGPVEVRDIQGKLVK